MSALYEFAQQAINAQADHWAGKIVDKIRVAIAGNAKLTVDMTWTSITDGKEISHEVRGKVYEKLRMVPLGLYLRLDPNYFSATVLDITWTGKQGWCNMEQRPVEL